MKFLEYSLGKRLLVVAVACFRIQLGHAFCVAAFLLLCSQTARGTDINEDTFRDNLRVLASDNFEGRAPASRGGDLTTEFLVEKLASYGVLPGNKGRFKQEVPLQVHETQPATKMTFEVGSKDFPLRYGQDFVVKTRRQVQQYSQDKGEIIFVGYGIVAPEFDWNDYDGIDVTGKTVVVLVNDPGFASNDEELFSGKNMTYYGRWTYKIEEASKQGADGVILVHEEQAATYPWEVVYSLTANKQHSLLAASKNTQPIAFEGWITNEVARKVFTLSGNNYDALVASASLPGFKAAYLDAELSLSIENTYGFVKSDNVIGIIPDTTRADEYILFVSHWDHMGQSNKQGQDTIYNGAVDNATGVAGLLELAKAFATAKITTERTVVILSVTAEEYGLLGSKYYVQNPVFPLNRTAAIFNIDMLNVFGPTSDISVSGYGRSDLDAYVEQTGQQHQKAISKNPGAERGRYYRSDHFNFAKAGVPALFILPGQNHRVHGREWMGDREAEYYAERYHTPEDEYHENWDLSGAVEDLKFIFDLGNLLANSKSFPCLAFDNEFREVRNQSMERSSCG